MHLVEVHVGGLWSKFALARGPPRSLARSFPYYFVTSASSSKRYAWRMACMAPAPAHCPPAQERRRTEAATSLCWYPTLHRLNCDFHHASQRDFDGLSGQSESYSGWCSVGRSCSIGDGATRLWRHRHSGFLVVISPSTIQPRLLHRYQEEDCRHPTRRAAKCMGCIPSWIHLG